MEVTLVLAGNEDKEFLRKLHRITYYDTVVKQFGCWDNTLQNRFFEDRWSDEEYQLVKFEDNVIGAFSILEKEAHFFLSVIQILPEFQGQGVGSFLIKRVQVQAHIKGKPIMLEVLRENKKAQSFYANLGFKETGNTEVYCIMENKEFT